MKHELRPPATVGHEIEPKEEEEESIYTYFLARFYVLGCFLTSPTHLVSQETVWVFIAANCRLLILIWRVEASFGPILIETKKRIAFVISPSIGRANFTVEYEMFEM